MPDAYIHKPVKDIKAGDTVVIDGVHKTVCKKDLGHDALLGATLWGDSHRAGRDLVKTVVYAAQIQRQNTKE